MSANELAVFNWQEYADHQLCLMIGGYNSCMEYYEDGEYRDEIIAKVLECYNNSLRFWVSSHKAGHCSVFLSDLDIEEDIMQMSSEAAYEVAHTHFLHSEQYASERAMYKTDDDIGDVIDDICTQVWECESGAYSPYAFHSVPQDVLSDHKMAYVVNDDSDFDHGIFAIRNDAQNVLFDECVHAYSERMLMSEEYHIFFVRIPQEFQGLESGKQ